MSKAFKKEQRIVTEVIKLYKEFPCLWDHRKVIHANREARDHAYELMLEKYQQLFKTATINDLKKRIENMRASYRREHKRVLLLQKKGEEYDPQLWYYDMMTFLNEVMDFQIPEENGSDSDVIKITNGKKPAIRIKIKSSPSLSSLDLEDSNNSTVLVDSYTIKQECDTADPLEPATDVLASSPASTLVLETEPELFGTTLGLQLKELDNLQRIFAEKLISDVIYHARLKRLTLKSYLVL